MACWLFFCILDTRLLWDTCKMSSPNLWFAFFNAVFQQAAILGPNATQQPIFITWLVLLHAKRGSSLFSSPCFSVLFFILRRTVCLEILSRYRVRKGYILNFADVAQLPWKEVPVLTDILSAAWSPQPRPRCERVCLHLPAWLPGVGRGTCRIC